MAWRGKGQMSHWGFVGSESGARRSPDLQSRMPHPLRWITDYPEKAVNYLMTACDLMLGAGKGRRPDPSVPGKIWPRKTAGSFLSPREPRFSD